MWTARCPGILKPRETISLGKRAHHLNSPPDIQRGRPRAGRSTPRRPTHAAREWWWGRVQGTLLPARLSQTERWGWPRRTAWARLPGTQVCLTSTRCCPKWPGPTDSDRRSSAAAALPGYLGPRGSGSPPAGPQHEACPLPTQALEVAGDCQQLKWPGGVSRTPAQWGGCKAECRGAATARLGCALSR